MNSFIKESNFFGKTNGRDLLEKYGSPLYVYNEAILRDRMHKVTQVITKYPFRSNYSIKANSNIEILKIALSEGVNADAMSVGEIMMLEKAGFPKEQIFFVPNNVSKEEMQFAIDRDIMISLDSLSQLKTFGEINRGGKCAVRINPGVGAGHHEKVVTAGNKTKFGIEECQVDEIFEICKEYDITIAGINQHVGSLFMDPEPFLMAVKNFLRIAMKFEKLDFIDFGGGYGTPYHKLDGEHEFDMKAFSEKLEVLVDEFVKDYGYAPLFKSEPGRYCVAEGGVILGNVYSVKDNASKRYIGTDIGMNVLVRPSIYDSYHDIEVIRDGMVVAREDMEEATVVGNICETGDILAKERMLPKMQVGDAVCVLDAGAYGYSMSSPYNSRPRAAEVLIDLDGNDRVIRRRETIEDLMRLF